MNRLLPPALLALLTVPTLGQVQTDWRIDYSTAALPSSTFEQTITCAVAPNGDLVWASRHYAVDGPPFYNLLERGEVHRTTTAGQPVWTLSSPATNDSHFYGVGFDAAGDCYLWGERGTTTGALTKPLVAKVSAGGTLLWTRTVVGTGYLAIDRAFGGFDAQGRFTFFGTHEGNTTDNFVRTFDANGNVVLDVWTPSVPLGLDGIWAVEPFPGGGFAVAGSGLSGAFVARLAADGTPLWRAPVPPGPSEGVRFFDIAVDPGGRIAAAGAEVDPNLNTRTVLTLLDPNGNRLLEYVGSWPGSAAWHECHFSPDGSLWLVSHEAPQSQSNLDCVLRRWRPDLTLATERTLPSGWMRSFVGESGQLWALVGQSELHEYSPAGNLNWSVPLSPGQPFDQFWSLVVAPDRRFITFGHRDNSAGANSDTDAVLLQLDASDLARGYCVGTGGTLGCAPHVEFEGAPRTTPTSSFVVHALPWPNQTAGRFLVGVGPAIANPFFGGTLCVGAPRVRTPSLFSGGNPVGAPDCSGSLTLDYGAWANGTLGGASLPGLQVAGTSVRLQAWSRDTGPATSALLSNALEFTLLP